MILEGGGDRPNRIPDTPAVNRGRRDGEHPCAGRGVGLVPVPPWIIRSPYPDLDPALDPAPIPLRYRFAAVHRRARVRGRL